MGHRPAVAEEGSVGVVAELTQKDRSPQLEGEPESAVVQREHGEELAGIVDAGRVDRPRRERPRFVEQAVGPLDTQRHTIERPVDTHRLVQRVVVGVRETAVVPEAVDSADAAQDDVGLDVPATPADPDVRRIVA